MLYSINEKTLCFHGPLIYQAKVLKAEKWTAEDTQDGTTGPHYFVHYQGWKQTWDEWVPESRVLKYNDENIAKQKALVAARKAPQPAPAAEKRNDDSSRKGKESGSRGTKRARDTVEQEDEYVKRPEIKLTIPDILKVQLVDDWENITKNSELVPLPRKPCVQDILKQYREHYLSIKKDGKIRPRAILDEVLAGLQLYFDKALGQNLLYRFERAQYLDMRKQHVPKMAERRGQAREAVEEESEASAAGELEPSKVYGGEHLLRLFVNLPGIIAHTSMDADSIALLKEHLSDFMSFLVKERKRLFLTAYEASSPAYQRLTQT